MKIQKDKKLHLMAGFSIFFSLVLFGKVFALVGAGLAGLGKELYDYKHKDKHTVDFYDFLFTLIGGIIGYLITVVM